MIDRRGNLQWCAAAFSAAAWAFAFLAGLQPAGAQIQFEQADPGARPRPTPRGSEATEPGTPPRPAYIRAFVIPNPGNTKPVTVVSRGQVAEQVVTVASIEAGERSVNPGYVEVPAGDGAVELKSGEQSLGGGAMRLSPGRAYTVVVWQTNQGWQTKAFADDLASPNVADRAVRILNFAEGRETMLSVGEAQEARVPADSVQEIKTPPKVANLAVRVLAKDGGPPAMTSVVVDFAGVPSGYLVVVPDRRGRMRPEFFEGGAPPPPPVEAVPVVAQPLSPQEEAARQRGLARLDLEHQLGQILVQMNQPGEEGNRARLEAKKQELERRLKGGTPAATPAPTPAPAPAR